MVMTFTSTSNLASSRRDEFGNALPVVLGHGQDGEGDLAGGQRGADLFGAGVIQAVIRVVAEQPVRHHGMGGQDLAVENAAHQVLAVDGVIDQLADPRSFIWLFSFGFRIRKLRML